MKRCPKCANEFPDDANFCPVDAAKLEPDAGATIRGHASAESLTVGSKVDDRFTIAERIGGGRSGDVFRATDKNGGGSVVIKCVAAAAGGNAARFEDEAKRLLKVNHPNVCRTLATGRNGDLLWVACEWAKGSSLESILGHEGAIAPEKAAVWISAIAEGLAACNTAQAFHRQLTPHNIFIDGANVKLVNMVAPDVAPSDTVQAYWPPEQTEGGPLDASSLVFSLAALALHMLSGKAPFAGSKEAMLTAKRQRPAFPPSIGPDLQTVLAKGLSAGKAQRHFDPKAFATDFAKAAKSSAGKAKPAEKASSTIMGIGLNHLKSDGEMQIPPPSLASMSGAQLPGATAAQPGAGNSGVGALPARVTTPPQLGKNGPNASQASPPQAIPMTAPAPNPSIPPPVATPIDAPIVGAPSGSNPPPVSDNKGAVHAKKESMPPNGTTVQAKPSGKAQGKRKHDEAGKSNGNGGGAGGRGFRETMWFKKGELDAAAAQEAAKSKEDEGIPDKVDLLPVEDRYKDDGSISAQDQDRLSLRTGGTQMMEAAKPRRAPSEVSENELVSELKGGRGPIFAAFAVGLLLIIGLMVYFFK